MPAPLVPPELLDPVVGYFQPRRVIIFGSVARGEAGPHSDMDLLVVLDDDAPPDKLTLNAGYEARETYDYPPTSSPVVRIRFAESVKSLARCPISREPRASLCMSGEDLGICLPLSRAGGLRAAVTG
jgi:hypothetical protein